MKCCCKDYVETSFVLGIVLAVLSFLGCVGDIKDNEYIPIGVVGVFIHGILIFGSIKRNATAILFWSILGIIYLIGLICLKVILIIKVSTQKIYNLDHRYVLFMSMIALCTAIIFHIWTHFVAYRARCEIISTDLSAEKGNSGDFDTFAPKNGLANIPLKLPKKSISVHFLNQF